MTFEEELRALINRYSKENTSDTPDHILAKYLCNTLDIYNVTVNRRDEWLGRKPIFKENIELVTIRSESPKDVKIDL